MSFSKSLLHRLELIKKFTFHSLGFVLHLSQCLLVSNKFFYSNSKFILEFLDLRLSLVNFVDFWQIIILLWKLNSSFFSISFDILFWLILTVVNLLYLLFKLVNKAKCMSLRILLACTNCIGNVIFIMCNIPHTICSSQLISLIWFGS